MDKSVEQNLQSLSKLWDTLIEFAVAYGFQLLGALVFLFVGLKIATWVGARVGALAEARDIDQTLAKFMGSIVKIVVVAFVAIITLGNFGISIAPLIALAGASAFGATLALQGPLSNYGAGLSIVLARPFTVGNTISIPSSGVSGQVEEVKMAHTILRGEDGERITIPSKDIVGRVVINSSDKRVVQTKIALDPGADVDKAIAAAAKALDGVAELAGDPGPQIGVHDFTYGGIVLGVRFWVPTSSYFRTRYAVNGALRTALEAAGVKLMDGARLALSADSLSADEDENAFHRDTDAD